VACFDDAVKRGAFARAWRRRVSSEELTEMRIAFGSPDADMRELRVTGTSGAAARTKG
jgi:hypothetical protein